jgi:hypothetical protein
MYVARESPYAPHHNIHHCPAIEGMISYNNVHNNTVK